YDYGMSATVGSPFHPWGIPMGILGGVTYGNDWDLTKSHRNYYIVGAGDELELQHGYDFETLEHSIDRGGIVTAGINPSDNHKILSTTMLIRTTDNENRIYHGRNRDAGTVIRVTRQRWLERELFVQQLTGEHTIPVLANLGIDWRYTFSKAKRDEPDRRETRYDLVENTGAYILSDRPEGNQRLFSYLEDENHDLGLDLSMPFKDWRGLEAKAKVGAAYVTRERKVDTRRFKYQHKGPLSTDPDVISKPADEIFVPENIGPDGFQFEEITRPTDNYSAEQEITAVYAMADLPILEPWRVIGGARYEESTQKLETFELFNPNSEPIEADLASDDILPAVNMTYALTDEMLVRAAYSKTISRPDFRELSPATFNDVTGGRQIFGNENLDRTLIENLDARWEWYPSNDQSLSFGAFYKLFQDPIEQIVVPSAQQSVTFENADEATNWGLELDFRNNYGFVANWAEDLYTAGNLSWIESKVKLGDDVGVQTEDERPLQGQSPYVINLMLGYDNLDSGTSASVLYNVFGPRIDQVGAQGAPDIIEEPFHQLDLVASQSLPYGFKIKAKAQNLLDLEARKMQDDEIVERYFKGRAFSLSLSWRY
ncbi:TonB-dependent receptor, partial [bacterium]|nr:TonB-dependent receptor [bacterium]